MEDPSTNEDFGFAGVRFGDSEAGPIYDYVATFPVKPGDKVWVETRRGKSVVTVVNIMPDSDKATAKILEPYVKPGEDEEKIDG